METISGPSVLQQVLSKIIVDPEVPLAELVARETPDGDETDRGRRISEVLATLKALRQQTSDKSAAKGPEDERVLRYTTSWILLRRIDDEIKSLKQKDLARLVMKANQAEERLRLLGQHFGRVLALEPCEPKFLGVLGEAFQVGPDWAYLHWYRGVLTYLTRKPNAKVKRPELDIGLFDRQSGKLYEQNLARLIWWVLRCCHLTVADYGPSGTLEPAVDEMSDRYRRTLEDYGLRQLLHLRPDLALIRSRVDPVVREVVRNWLGAHGLRADQLPRLPELRRDFIGAYIAANRLDLFVVVLEGPAARDLAAVEPEALLKSPSPARGAPDHEVGGAAGAALHQERDAALARAAGAEAAASLARDELAALQAELLRSRSEERTGKAALEEEVARLRAAAADVGGQLNEARRELEQLQGGDLGARRDLREFLVALDSATSLDRLWEAFRGQEERVSLRTLVNQLCVAMNRAGVVPYPARGEFVLDYEQAGLYERLGFDVDPGQAIHVRVERPGWALKHGRKLIPIRRARVVADPAPELQP